MKFRFSTDAVNETRKSAYSSRFFIAAALFCGCLATPSFTSAQTVRATTFGTTTGTMPGSSRLAGGLSVSVKIDQSLSSRSATEGQQWDGVLARDLIVAGHLVTPAGTQVTGVVSKAISAKRSLGNGTLALKLTTIHGTGVNTDEVMRQGVNPALTSTGNTAAAGIPGEAAQSTTGITPTADAPNAVTLAEARITAGSIMNFTTE